MRPNTHILNELDFCYTPSLVSAVLVREETELSPRQRQQRNEEQMNTIMCVPYESLTYQKLKTEVHSINTRKLWPLGLQRNILFKMPKNMFPNL